MVRFERREDFIEFITGRIKMIITALFWVILVASPFVSLVIKSILLNIDAFAIPPERVEELILWRELYSFSEVGFDFGYASTFPGSFAEISHFGNHGLSAIFAWGFYALFFEWGDNAIVIFSLVSLIISLVIFIAAVRPKIWQSILMILLILTNSYINIYNSLSMMEISVLASVISATALIINHERSRSRISLALAVLLIIYCGLLRISNLFLFIPLVCIVFKRMNLRFILTAAGCAVVSLGVYLATSLFKAPYPDEISASVMRGFVHPIKVEGLILATVFVAIAFVVFLFITFIRVEGSFKKRDIKIAPRFKLEYFGFSALIFAIYISRDAGAGTVSWYFFSLMSPILFASVIYLITKESTEKFIKKVAIPVIVVAAVVTSVGFYVNLQMLPISDDYDYKIGNMTSPISELALPEGESYGDKTVAFYDDYLSDGDIFKHIPAEYGIIYDYSPTAENAPTKYGIKYIVVSDYYIEEYPFLTEGYSYLFDANERLKLYEID